MNTIGFNTNGSNAEAENVLQKGEQNASCGKAINNVVTVRFKNGIELPYYNNKFNLNEGDRVFVDGKYYGSCGVVTEVITKFKISRKQYKDVIAKLDLTVHGNFKKFENFMISTTGTTATREQILSWLIPPFVPQFEGDEPDEFIYGEGYFCDLKTIPCSTETLDDGLELLNDGKLTVLIIKDGIGTAFFEGKTGHVVDFKYNNSGLTEMFCDCIKPNFCKHFAAICIFLNDLTKEKIIKPGDAFFAVSGKWFYEMMQNREISL